MSTVQVYRIHTTGSLDNLVLESDEYDHDTQSMPHGYVRVKVHAVGLNFADVFACLGLYSATPQGSFVPGLEFAGVVEEVGSTTLSAESKDGKVVADVGGTQVGGKISLKRGDRVCGVTRFGGYATHITVDVRYVRRIPDSWTFNEGCAFPVQAFTAFYALKSLGNVRPGQAVLVHSLAGGVGLAALQILRKYNANIIGTVGSHSKKQFLVERFGLSPDSVIVRSEHDGGCESDLNRDRQKSTGWIAALKRSSRRWYRWVCSYFTWETPSTLFHQQLEKALKKSQPPPSTQPTTSPGFDIILDSLAGDFFHPSHSHLNPMGRHIIFGAASYTPRGRVSLLLNPLDTLLLGWSYFNRPRVDPMSLIPLNRSIMGFNLIWLWDRVDEFQGMFEELEGLELEPPVVGRVFKWDELKEAVEFLRSGASVGKVVVEVGE
ncbi:hypothetical protein HK102_011885 [Quaeritorhiza haematococci]|nr:hypothetical protein HK102_011885 [Quaeritorhiza haematococci]